MSDYFLLVVTGFILISLIALKRLKVDRLFAISALVIIPVINSLADSFAYTISLGGTSIGQFRALLLIAILIILVAGQIPRHASSVAMLVFLLYLYLLLWLSSNPTYSVNNYLKILISLLTYPFALRFVRNISTLKVLSITSMVVGVIIILQLSLAQILELGSSVYARVFYQGGAAVQISYTLVLIILLGPMYIRLFPNNRQRTFIYLLLLGSLIMVALIGRRISYLAIVTGLITYLLFSSRRYLAIMFVSGAVIALLVIWPIISPIVDANLSGRLDQNTTLEDISTEARYRETVFVFEEFLSRSMKHSLVGTEALNSSGFFLDNQKRYTDFVYRRDILEGRMLHVDYNRLLFGSGVIGLFLYLLMLGMIAYEFTQNFNRSDPELISFDISTTFWSVLIASLVISFSGSMGSIGYRTLLFLFLGAFVGLTEQKAMDESPNPKNDSARCNKPSDIGYRVSIQD